MNSVRIEKAKELLKKSERKISHISKSVGYDNPKYFFRVFKKYTGFSPEQYKKQEQSKVNPL
ncbi:helix-turn-helix domain-containing protein [Niallia taxi]|uniref:helix-turn-helix domain-containing protein n=1 Tax=Niallia taxi TaxID=2499688 RepID=UPI003AB81ABD